MINNIYDWYKIGDRIYTERKNNKISQFELAKEIGIARQTLSKLERGECVNIGLDTILGLCNIFNCEIGYLLCEYDCKTRGATDIVKETGLSEKSIDILKKANTKMIPEEYSESDETYREICVERNKSRQHFLKFIDSVIKSKEFFEISNACEIITDNYTKYKRLNLGLYWEMEKRFNDFIENFTNLKSIQDKIDKKYETEV